ncbi:MAG: hypothetical protein U0414_39105 [Polyangiaceae bacterium]
MADQRPSEVRPKPTPRGGPGGYRTAAESLEPTAVIAVPRLVGRMYLLLGIPATCFAMLPVAMLGGGRGLAILAGVFLFLLALFVIWVRSLVANARGATMTATAGALVVGRTGIFGGRLSPLEIPWSDVRKLVPAYMGSSSEAPRRDPVSGLILRHTDSEEGRPARLLFIELEEGSHRVVTSFFQPRPEVLARRIRRFRDGGPAGLRATEGEIEAQRARFSEEHDLSAGWLAEASVLRVSRDGIRVGRTQRTATLIPWENVVAAHVLQTVAEVPDVLQIELADGRAIDVKPRKELSRAQLAALLAPRWVDVDGAEHSVLDVPKKRVAEPDEPSDVEHGEDLEVDAQGSKYM